MKLSTRPEKFLGEVETWDRAEARLKEALDKFNGEGRPLTRKHSASTKQG